MPGMPALPWDLARFYPLSAGGRIESRSSLEHGQRLGRFRQPTRNPETQVHAWNAPIVLKSRDRFLSDPDVWYVDPSRVSFSAPCQSSNPVRAAELIHSIGLRPSTLQSLRARALGSQPCQRRRAANDAAPSSCAGLVIPARTPGAPIVQSQPDTPPPLASWL